MLTPSLEGLQATEFWGTAHPHSHRPWRPVKRHEVLTRQPALGPWNDRLDDPRSYSPACRYGRRAQLLVVQLARSMLGPRCQQLRWTQEAADVVGSERGTLVRRHGILHGGSARGRLIDSRAP